MWACGRCLMLSIAGKLTHNRFSPFPSFRLLRVDNNHSEEDSEDIKEKSEDKESRLNSDKEVGVFVLEKKWNKRQNWPLDNNIILSFSEMNSCRRSFISWRRSSTMRCRPKMSWSTSASMIEHQYHCQYVEQSRQSLRRLAFTSCHLLDKNQAQTTRASGWLSPIHTFWQSEEKSGLRPQLLQMLRQDYPLMWRVKKKSRLKPPELLRDSSGPPRQHAAWSVF